MPPSSRQLFPAWARLTLPTQAADDDDDDDVSVEREDAYLRTKVYHAGARAVDRAWQRALEQQLRRMQKDDEPDEEEAAVVMVDNRAGQHQQQQQPPNKKARLDDENHPSAGSSFEVGGETHDLPPAPGLVPSSPAEEEREDDDDSSSLAQQFTLPPLPTTSSSSTSYYNNYETENNELLLSLPLTVWEGPLAREDRAAYLAALVRLDPPRTCTVWLRPATSTTSWPEELMRQCLAQEPQAKAIFSSLKRKRRQPTLSSLTDILVAWAGRTRSFDAIAVYLELSQQNKSSHYPNEQQRLSDFVQWCADRRAVHGLPLRLTILVAAGGVQLPPNSCSSSCRLRVKRLVAPTAHDMLRAVVEQPQRLDDNHHHTDTDQIPLFSSSASAATCRHAFRHQHGSAVHVLRQLQRDWAVRLAVPGAYLFLNTTTTGAVGVPPVHRRRLASLLLHPEFAALVLNNKSSTSVEDLRSFYRQAQVRRRVVRVARQVQWILYRRCNNNHDNDDNDAVPYLLFQDTNDRYDRRRLEPEDRRALLAPIAQALMSTTTTTTTKKDIDDFTSSGGDDDKIEWRHALHELVILLEHCPTASQAQRSLGETILGGGAGFEDSHHHRLVEQQQQQQQLVGDEPPQPRRDHVTALLEGALDCHDSKDACSSEIHVPGYLYRILLDRAALPEGEWFQAFVETYRHHSNNSSTSPEETAATPQALFDLFGCGVRQLQIAGLIRPRRAGGKAGIVYEKTALVWCGGD